MKSTFKKISLVIIVLSILFFALKENDHLKKQSESQLETTKENLPNHSKINPRPKPKIPDPRVAIDRKKNPQPKKPQEFQLDRQQQKKLMEERAEKLNLQMTEDKKTLNDGQVDFRQRSSALMRLASKKDSDARDVAMELLKSKDKRESSVAYRALGYFDEEKVNNELKELANSDDPDAKRFAIEALSWNPKKDSGRKEILEEFVSSSKSLDTNTIKAMGAVYVMSNDEETKSEYFNKIMEVAQSPEPTVEKSMAVKSLLLMDSKNPEVQALREEMKTLRRTMPRN